MNGVFKFYDINASEDRRAFENNEVPSQYCNPLSIDNAVHQSMYQTITPIVRTHEEATFLTVGDGKYGSDANFLLSLGCRVTASNLAVESLKEAHAKGWIEEWLEINVEDIALPDCAFDFILCKHTYHHLPRPPLGLYEMLRVAKRGVILIEPLDNQAAPFFVSEEFIKRAAPKRRKI
ncbi:MAG: class I SAM-dependent methyltransferase [Deltaproteobacteria bacterium]|nr:class I SAM-dependent methyltransferase [Deltaproteobacteria bacterium]